jgi:PASTA domain
MLDLLLRPLRRHARTFSDLTGAATDRAPRRARRATRHARLPLAAAVALILAPGAGNAWAADWSGAFVGNVAAAPTGGVVAIWTENPGANSIVQAASRPAGGAWQPPVNVSAPGAGGGEVAIGPTGDAVAVWTRPDGVNRIVQAAARPAGGGWQAPVDLSAPTSPDLAPHVAVGAGGVAYAVWLSRNTNGTSVVQAAARSAGGAWQAPVDLSSPGRNDDGPRVAVDSEGDAVAVWGWQDQSGTGHEVVQAAARPAGGAWHAPVTLSAVGDPADMPRVAMNPAGVAYAVWRDPSNNGTVQAAARAAGGAWQPRVDLSTPDQNAYDPQVAINGAGDAVAVWDATSATDLTGDHVIVQAAVRSAHAVTRFWQAPVNLSAPGLGHNPEVALDSAGDAVAVWNDVDLLASSWVVRAAARPAATGVWQAPATLSAADQNHSFSPLIALDSAGDAVAVWDCGDGLTFPSAARAAEGSAASGVWQPPVDLSAPGCVATTRVPDVVGWSKRFAGPKITEAGLVPRFTGATTATVSYVASETPAPDTRVARGSTVTLYLKPGFPP